MKRLFRDPLVVFLLIGGGIFLLYAKLRPEESLEETNPNRIEITSDIQSLLASEWSTRWNRPATPDEFKGLLDSYIKEEILFREATKLGLDQSDSIIRRRLAQKMEFLTSDIASLEEVSDQTLAAFHQENADRYRIPPEIGFQQLYFSTDKRKESATADAEAMLPSLIDGSLSFDQALDQTDRSLLSPEFAPTSLPQIGRQFGTNFEAALADAKPGDWFGPAQSGYGVHLVKIFERTEGKLPELNSIREKVLNDYRFEQQEKFNDEMLKNLLEQYEIVIDAAPEESEPPEAP